MATLLGMGGSLFTAGPAAACSSEVHCYAISEWPGVSIKNVLVDAHTSLAEVPEGAGTSKYGPREQDETWSDFSSDPYNSNIRTWIEVGDTTGFIGTREFKHSPVFFEADESWYYPTYNYPNFTEVDYPSQEPGGNWWDADTYTENSGSWCAWIDETDVFCFPGLEQYANHLQDGLEYAANNDPERNGGAYAKNTGQVIGYAENSSGVVSQWTGGHLVYGDEPGDPWPPAGAWGVCGNLGALGQGNGAITVEAPAWLDWPECSSAAEYRTESLLAPKQVASAGKTPAEILAAFGAPKPTAGSPLAGYSAPSSNSASLTSGELEARAQEIASSYGGDSTSPERVRSVMDEPLSSALAVAVPSVSPPQQETAGMSAWEQSSTDVISMDGDFSLGAAPRPAGAQAPEGHVLTVVLDAHTGNIDAIALNGTDPTLASLGTVHTLG